MELIKLSVILVSLALASCELTPDSFDSSNTVSPPITILNNSDASNILNSSALADGSIYNPGSYVVIGLTGVLQLNLFVGPAVTGTITVQIRNDDGSTVVVSSQRNANSLTVGTGWNIFRFPAFTLTPQQKYRIYVTRSDPHNYGSGNYIFWNTSSPGNDAYPQGVNDVYPDWTLDYAFVTYSGGYVDQQQISANYGFFVDNSFYRWQDFVPDRPKTAFTRLDLNLQKGPNVTGNINISIMNSNGSQLLWSTSLNANTYLVSGKAWNTFWVNSLNLYIGDKYRIYVSRTDAHNYPAGNYIFWSTSSGGNDAYPYGVNDVYPSWILDYSFITYANGFVDQQQTSANYGFALANNYVRWQEFVFKH